MKSEIPEIPDVTVIDLEQGDEQISETESDEFEELDDEPKKGRFRINMHIVLLATIVIIIPLVIYRISNWGNPISHEDIFSDGEGTYDNSLDNIVPLLDEDGNLVSFDHSDGFNIVAFGNAPFSDDRGSKDNLANLIAERTGATVYNCSVSGSYLAAGYLPFDADVSPIDAYGFYWLSVVASGVDSNYYGLAAEALGDELPPDATEAIETLKAIDFNTVDAIVVMYDAADYLMGHPIYNGEYHSDPLCFTGNLAAGIERFQDFYPHIRIIVLSPAYAFAIDENGDYISSDIQRYENDVLSTYSILEGNTCVSLNVTFVDNLYGTINEDNALEYLVDNVHLNLSGRRAVADRAADAILFFGEGQ